MKLTLPAFFLFVIGISLFPINLNLKNRINIDSDIVTLYDVISNDEVRQIPNILITELDRPVKRLKGAEILNKLSSEGFYDVTLTGEEIMIIRYTDENNDKITERTTETSGSPIIELQKKLQSFIDNDNFRISLRLRGLEPFIDLSMIKSDYEWQIYGIEQGLKDINKLKNIPLIVNGIKHNATLDINIYADILIAKGHINKNMTLSSDLFKRSMVDISSLKDTGSVVYSHESVKNTTAIRNINAGDILRWSCIRKTPDVKKGEKLKFIIRKEGIEIIRNCRAKSDSFDNEKINIELENGKEISGVLKNKEGSRYVEL